MTRRGAQERQPGTFVDCFGGTHSWDDGKHEEEEEEEEGPEYSDAESAHKSSSLGIGSAALNSFSRSADDEVKIELSDIRVAPVCHASSLSRVKDEDEGDELETELRMPSRLRWDAPAVTAPSR